MELLASAKLITKGVKHKTTAGEFCVLRLAAVIPDLRSLSTALPQSRDDGDTGEGVRGPGRRAQL